MDSEITAPAMKIAIYSVVFANMNLIAGRLGLNVGAIPEWPGVGMLGMGIIGGWDWGPDEGSKASNGVASSIVLCRRGGFTTGVFHAISETFSVYLDDFFNHFLQRKGRCLHSNKVPVKQKDRDAQTNNKGKERRCPANRSRNSFACNDGVHYLLASKFKESGSAVHGTSSDTNRTQPVST